MKKVGLTLMVLAMISGVAYYVFTHPDLDRAEQLEREVGKLDEQNRALERENERLAKRVEALKEDPRLAEREARESAGLVRPGEVVFQFERSDGPLEVDVRLQVGSEAVELAGRSITLGELDVGLKSLREDMPQAALKVGFDEGVDALRRQQVEDVVAGSWPERVTYLDEDD